jgi:Asp/Glu/hydantoin racemase
MIGLIHSTRVVIEPVHNVVVSSGADVEVIHVLDEGLLRALKRVGKITEDITRWMTGMVQSVEREGADLAVVTCSSLSPCVNAIREVVNIPVLKIDEPMVEWAVKQANTIGLVMTNPTTEVPSKLLFEEVSQRLGKPVTVRSQLCSEAFLRLNQGDAEGHDEEVIRTVNALLEDVDLVVLAQISIARVIDKLDEQTASRVLSSLNFLAPSIRDTLAHS